MNGFFSLKSKSTSKHGCILSKYFFSYKCITQWVCRYPVYFMRDIVILKYTGYKKYMIIPKYFAQRVKDNIFLPIGRSFNFIIKTEIWQWHHQKVSYFSPSFFWRVKNMQIFFALPTTFQYANQFFKSQY